MMDQARIKIIHLSHPPARISVVLLGKADLGPTPCRRMG